MPSVREPIKKTSIANKERIIKVGFELICRNGFHNVTCIDIAKAAGVSTGSIYQYFNNKRAIFIAGVKNYADSIMFPALDLLTQQNFQKTNLKAFLDILIESFIQNHTMQVSAHEELMAMSHLDEDIGRIFRDNELVMTNKIADLLMQAGFNSCHLKEKIHVAIALIDNYCHEVIYHQHANLNYQYMKSEIIEMISRLLS